MRSDKQIELHRAWSDHVYRFAQWDTFTTVTFDTDVSAATVQVALEAWARAISETAGHFPVAAVIAPHLRGRLHLHVLTALEDRPPVEVLTDAWRAMRRDLPIGHVDTRLVYERRGVTEYLVSHGEPVIGVVCPRTGSCAHRRCTVGPPPW